MLADSSNDGTKDGSMPDDAGAETSADPDVPQLLQRLNTVIQEAEVLLRGLESERLDDDAAGDAVAKGMSRRLAAADTDRRELTSRLVEAERRAERLMTLYVATFHLHAHQEPPAVESAIAEIAVDLLGARRFVLLLRDRERCRVAMSRPVGMPLAEVSPMFAGGYYEGGDPLIDATLEDGVLRLASETGAISRALAAVPLNMGDETSGALVILDLLEQKGSLTADDRDLLDLLAAHAASALLAAQLFSLKERKLRTYKSLLELAKGEP
jgi:hypothetical protein